MLSLSLEWERCPDGVELFDYGRKKTRRRQTLIGAAAAPSALTFRSNSARRFPVLIERSDLEAPLVVRFINARDDAARAEFFARFGFLYKSGNGKPQSEQPRADVLADQRSLGKLLAAVGTVGRAKGAAQLNQVMAKSPGLALRPEIGHAGGLSLHPQSLLGLMLMELAMVVDLGARLTACAQCKIAFLTGPMTGRRGHAVYCSDRCRVAAMRVRNRG